MLNKQEVSELAFDVACDYKPWADNLSPQEYFEYGYNKGYLRARADIMRDLGLTEVEIHNED